MMSDFSGSFLTPSPPNVRFLPSNVQFLESFLVIFDSPLKSDRHHLCTFPKEDIDVIWNVSAVEMMLRRPLFRRHHSQGLSYLIAFKDRRKVRKSGGGGARSNVPPPQVKIGKMILALPTPTALSSFQSGPAELGGMVEWAGGTCAPHLEHHNFCQYRKQNIPISVTVLCPQIF